LFIRETVCDSSDHLVLWHFPESVLTVAVEAEQVVVVLPEGISVGDSDQRDVHLLHVGVEQALNIDGNGTSALIQNGVQGFVVDKSGHGNSLLFSA